VAIPPATSTPPPAPPAGSPVNTGTVLQLPPSLTTALTGQLLEGVVAERLAGARVLIETSRGALILRTGFPLLPNTAVTLRFDTGGPRPSVTILPQGGPPSAGPTTTPTPPQGGPPIATGTVVTATVLRNAGVPVAGAPTSNAPTGTTGGPLSILVTGTQLPLRIVAISPPGPASPVAAPTAARAPAAGPALAVTVTGANDSGQTIVRTATGVELALATSRPLPAGANLLLGALTPAPLAGGLDPQSLALAPRWEALHEVLRLGDNSAARAILTKSIPRPGAQLAGSLLFFLSALRGGGLRGWLGQDAARLLESGGSLERLGREFAIMQRLASEPAGQDWRLFLVPFLSDEQLHQMRFFVRDDPGAAEDGAATGIRFIIEVTFTKLGPFQFDGLVRDKTMDLIVRTEQALSATARRDIAKIYGDSLAALGFTGGVAMRTESFFDVQPLQEAGLSGKPGVIA